jgi:hypothetical protein
MLPSRLEIRARLARLASGQDSPGAASDWASPWVVNDDLTDDDNQVWDEGVWEALTILSGADIKVSDTDYMYGREDYQDWLEEFDRSDPNGPQTPG